MRVSRRWSFPAAFATCLIGCGGEVAASGLATSSGSETAPVVDAGTSTTAAPDGGYPSFLPRGSLAGVTLPAFLAVDDANVYWASYEIGPVGKVPLTGGSSTELHGTSATTVAIDSTRVYTVSPNGGNAPQGLVMACEKSGCGANPTVLASGQSGVWGIAADDANVYWTRGDASAGVTKLSKAGGAPAVLVSGVGAGTISVSGGRVFFTGAAPMQYAQLMMVPVDGGTPLVLASASANEGIFGLVADAENAYFATTDGVIGQVPAGGGPVTTLATSQGRAIAAMAVDGERVYWAAPDLEVVASVPIGGGPMKTYPTGPTLDGLAVDRTSVYWSNRDVGTLMKLAK